MPPSEVEKSYGPNTNKGCIFTASGTLECGYVDGAAAILGNKQMGSYGKCTTGCSVCSKNQQPTLTSRKQ